MNFSINETGAERNSRVFGVEIEGYPYTGFSVIVPKDYLLTPSRWHFSNSILQLPRESQESIQSAIMKLLQP